MAIPGALHFARKECPVSQFGKIRWYNGSKGSGTIIPDSGGDVLPFRRSDLQDNAEPKTDERYSYDTSDAIGGRKRAINLRRQSESQTVEQQARAQRG
ncbi:cold-shock protein [Croceicoccus naphthovorans]|uniref:cold-shock protein n=1 Tax=Croceicoccus naphthovorans TaxID=1348774 RepID=UPI00069F8F99|nr:hypothetical protein [Croceicoccus naphthovorans]